MNKNQKAALKEKGLTVIELASRFNRTRAAIYDVFSDSPSHRYRKLKKRLCMLLEKPEDFLWPTIIKESEPVNEKFFQNAVKDIGRENSTLLHLLSILEDILRYSMKKVNKISEKPISIYDDPELNELMELVISTSAFITVISGEARKMHQSIIYYLGQIEGKD